MSRSSFLVLARRLSQQGIGPLYGFEYLTLDRVREGAEKLAETVERVCKEQGCEQVDIIGHSLGGLVGRYYVTCLGGASRIGHLFTVGSPHAGFRNVGFVLGQVKNELAEDSALIREMNAAPVPGTVRMVAIGSEADTLVPARRTWFQGAES